MNSVSVNNLGNPNFGHVHRKNKNPYPKAERAIVAGMTVLGTAASCALLAKNAGYSLKPAKMFKNVKDSYLSKVAYHDKQIITIGAGSTLGGLAGGYMIDDNPVNRKAKNREALMQIGNISIPILTVDFLSKQCGRFGNIAKSCGAVAGIFIGVHLANFVMNKLSNAIFRSRNGRGVKATDFSAHLDDALVAASYISSSPIVHGISRIIPIALLFAGNEAGNKKAPAYRGKKGADAPFLSLENQSCSQKP